MRAHSPRSSSPAVSAAELVMFEQMVKASANRLYRLAARLLGSTSDAEDVVQESCFRAFATFRDPAFTRPENPMPWLITVVTRVAVNTLRERKRRSARDTAWQQSRLKSQQTAEAHVQLGELSALLEALPEDQRVALVLKELEGLSTAEIATALGCSAGAVEQRIFRARTALKRRTQS